MSKPLVASNGITITDTMRFFCGDKPAQQFERGTQIGGTYKCGSCGCIDTMMQDAGLSTQWEIWKQTRTTSPFRA
jgi:hypothetical protein